MSLARYPDIPWLVGSQCSGRNILHVGYMKAVLIFLGIPLVAGFNTRKIALPLLVYFAIVLTPSFALGTWIGLK